MPNFAFSLWTLPNTVLGFFVGLFLAWSIPTFDFQRGYWRFCSGRGLSGWVRNCRDGTVEAAFAGPAYQVDDMIRACHRGPPHARVDKVDVTTAADVPEGGFRQVRTA